MTRSRLDIEAQRQALQEMLALARKLRDQGDDFLNGHYLHLQERIETVLAITETRADNIASAR